jgi:DNA polymerase-3 subunit beta
MKISAHNPQHEEAIEELSVEQSKFDRIAVGFNVTYLLDALGALDHESVQLSLRDANSSCLVTEPDNDLNRHVVMPLKL